MKKLNITKKQYDESKYFTKKYGALKFVSESGKLYKTDKGVVIALESEMKKEDGDDSIIDRLTDGDDKGDKGADEGDVTRGELTDMLKDVVAEVEKVCDAQDISFEEVAGVEKPEGESDEEADKDEVVATKDETAEVLQGVIDAVEKVADKNDIELPEPEEDEEKGDDEKKDDDEPASECTVTEEAPKTDAPCDDKLAKVRKILTNDELSADAMVAEIGEIVGTPAEESCPECGAPMKKECGSACECGGKDKFMEARKARRAKLVREAIARRAKVRKVMESIRRRRAAKKVMESIRRRRAMKRIMEARKARLAGKKVMESRRERMQKMHDRRVMESRRLRARRARLAK